MTRVYLRLWLALVAIALGGLAVLEVVLYSESFSGDAADYYEQYAEAGVRGTVATDVSPDEAGLDQIRALWPAPVEIGEPPAGSYPMGDDARWRHDGASELLYIDHPQLGWLRVGPFKPYPGPNWPNRGLLALLVIGGIGLAAWRLLRPLDTAQRAVAATADAIASGDLSARVPPEAAVAAAREVHAINTMADRIEALVAARQRLLRAASHELRTPIARLRIGIHLLANAQDGREEREAALDRDLAELDELVEELLLHARLQDPGVPLQAERLDLDEQVRLALSRLSLAHEVEVDLQTTAIVADARLLQRVLQNVLQNASRYASQRVRLRTRDRQGGTELEIADDGPGIPATDRELALSAFGMLDARSQHGLGLSIVAEVLARHGGHVTLDDAELGGLAVRTWWPASGSPPSPEGPSRPRR